MADKHDIDIEQLRQIANVKQQAHVKSIGLSDNDDADAIDNELKGESEKTYREIAQLIVNTSSKQLNEQNQSKTKLKSIFTIFFIVFISAQYVVLVGLMLLKALAGVDLSDTVLITYITSVFVETLGSIAVMIAYAFDSKQEVNILEILNGVISNFQKFGGTKDK